MISSVQRMHYTTLFLFSLDAMLNHEINSKQLAVFGGYKNGHLDSVEVFEDDTWMYTGRRLEEPKSRMAMVSLPEGLIRQNC